MFYLLFGVLGPVTLCLATELEVRFSDYKSTQGTIKYLIFNGAEGFPSDSSKSIAKGELDSKDFDAGIRVDVPDGPYGVTAFHDENSDGELNKNFLGLPKESFGFSNNPRIFFGPPSFERAKFSVEGPTTIEVRLKHL